MSNNLKRVIAGVLGIPLILLACFFRGEAFLAFSVIVTSIALWEFLKLIKERGNVAGSILILLGSAIMIIFYKDLFVVLSVFIAVVIFSMSIEIFRGQNKNPLDPVISIFGIIYITLPFILLNVLVNRPGFNFVIYIFVLIWTCDTFAYYGGKLFGKRKLSEISPKKTVEGSLTGFAFTVAVSFFVHIIFPEEIRLVDSVIIGIIAGVFSQIGDLFESLIKRYCNVKDSSGIIPGHGGMLDRFDSVIFTSPVIYLYCVMFVN